MYGIAGIIGIANILMLVSLVCITSRSIMPILYIFLLGMFALNRGFAYIGLPIGSMPIYLTEIVLAIFLLKNLLLLPIKKKIKKVRTPLDIPFAFYYLVGIALLLKDLPQYGILAVRDFVLVYYSLFFYVITENIRTFEDIQRIIKICLIGGTLSVVSYLGRPWLWPLLNQVALSNEIGYATHMSLSILFVIALRDYLAKKKIFYFIACIQIVAILKSMVRSTWVALAVSLVFLLIISAKKQRKSTLSVVVGIFAGVLILILGYSYFSNPVIFRELSMEAQSIYDINMSTSSAANTKWRVETTRIGLQRVLQNPLGDGFGRPAAIWETMSGGNIEVDYHNSHLSLLVRTGVLGFLIYLCINALFYYRALQFCVRTDKPLHRAYMTGILAGHMSIAINSMFFMVLQGPYMGIFYWIFMGLGIALINVSESPLSMARVRWTL